MKKTILFALTILTVTSLITSNAFATPIKPKYKDPKIYTQQSKQEDNLILTEDKKALLEGTLSIEDFYLKYPDIYELQKESSPTIKNTISPYATYTTLDYSFNFFTDSTSYGGNQMWHPVDSGMRNSGCGTVAAANIVAYDAKYYSRKNLYSITSGNYLNWTQSDFYKYQVYLYNNFNGGVTLLPEMKSRVPKIGETKGYTYSVKSNSCWSETSTTFTDMKNMIKAAIDAECPVALLLGPNKSNSYSDYYARPDIANHWVTVTGYNPYDPEQIEISNWGKKEYVDIWYLIRSKMFIDIAYFPW